MRFPGFEPREIQKTGDDSPASSLFRYVVRMSGFHQVWVCLIALLVAALTMIPLELQRRLVNDVIVDGNLDYLFLIAGIYLIVLSLQGGLKLALRLYQVWLGESAIRYNRRHLSRLHRIRGKDGEANNDGRAVSIIGPELDRLGGFVGEGFSQPVANLGVLISVGGFMLVIEPLVAAVGLLFLVPQAALVPWFQTWINRLLKKRLGLMRALSDSVSGLTPVRAPAQKGNTAPQEDSTDPGVDGEEGEGRLSGQIDRIFSNRMDISLIKFASKALINFLNALAPLCVLVFGGYLVIEGETTIGTIVAFVSGFDRLSNPLRELMGYYRLAAQANVQHQMIARWMAAPAGRSEPKSAG